MKYILIKCNNYDGDLQWKFDSLEEVKKWLDTSQEHYPERYQLLEVNREIDLISEIGPSTYVPPPPDNSPRGIQMREIRQRMMENLYTHETILSGQIYLLPKK